MIGLRAFIATDLVRRQVGKTGQAELMSPQATTGIYLRFIDLMGGIDHRVRVTPIMKRRRVHQSQVACRLRREVEDIPTLHRILIGHAIGQEYRWILANDLIMYTPDMHAPRIAKRVPETSKPFC